jgi:hypothetical protein
MLQFGMPYGFQQALDRKYAILAQDTAARANAANADANLTNVRAGLLPAESAANVGLTVAQTGQARAQTHSIDENTKFVKPLAEASIFNTKAQGTLFGQQAYGEYQLNRLSPTLAGGKRAPAAACRRGARTSTSSCSRSSKRVLATTRDVAYAAACGPTPGRDNGGPPSWTDSKTKVVARSVARAL